MVLLHVCDSRQELIEKWSEIEFALSLIQVDQLVEKVIGELSHDVSLRERIDVFQVAESIRLGQLAIQVSEISPNLLFDALVRK